MGEVEEAYERGKCDAMTVFQEEIVRVRAEIQQILNKATIEILDTAHEEIREHYAASAERAGHTEFAAAIRAGVEP